MGVSIRHYLVISNDLSQQPRGKLGPVRVGLVGGTNEELDVGESGWL
jgi:hypothetical protein